MRVARARNAPSSSGSQQPETRLRHACAYGDADEQSLYQAAQRVREGLLQHNQITQVDLEGARNLEVHIAIPEAVLRAHDLTLTDVAQAVRAMAVDRAGGSLETQGGNTLARE